MNTTHYYGDRVRSLLITAGVVMILSMPFFSELIPKPLFFSVLAVLLLILLSGLLSPAQRMIVGLTTLVSAGAFLIFQYYALIAFQAFGVKNAFFLVNELLAMLFLVATYFGTKSTRGLAQVQ